MQLYLNNSGSRWVNVDAQNKRDKVKFELNGKFIRSYAVKFWQAIGNFAVPVIVIKKKQISLVTSNRRDGEWTTYENKYN